MIFGKARNLFCRNAKYWTFVVGHWNVGRFYYKSKISLGMKWLFIRTTASIQPGLVCSCVCVCACISKTTFLAKLIKYDKIMNALWFGRIADFGAMLWLWNFAAHFHQYHTEIIRAKLCKWGKRAGKKSNEPKSRATPSIVLCYFMASESQSLFSLVLCSRALSFSFLSLSCINE